MRLKSAVNVGNVHATSAEFAGYQVQDQAFRACRNIIIVGLPDNFYVVLVTDTSSFSSDIHAQGYDGLLGLGPNKASAIRKKLGSSAGDTTLQRIFSENTTSQNYITFLLDRKNDPGNQLTGQLTLSEVIPGFENITSMPKLDVDKVNRLLQAGTQSLHMPSLYLIKILDQHWQAFTDSGVGIIGPDGQPIVVDSIVPGAPSGQFVAVFDSGYTFRFARPHITHYSDR